MTEDLEDLYERAPCGYVSLDRHARVVKVNTTICTWLDRSAKEILGRPFHEMLSVPSRMFFETHFAPLLRMQGFFHEVAVDLVANNDERLPVLANAMERRDAQGNLLFTRITVFKAAERRRYEREMVEARRAAEKAHAALGKLNNELERRVEETVAERLKLERALQSERKQGDLREQFIAVLGHDLKNPLAAIDSGLRVLSREQLSDRGEQVLSLVGKSTNRMVELIDDVLDFARGRLGEGIPVDRSPPGPLTPVLQQVIEEIASSNPDREIVVKLELSSDVECDRHRLAQMVSNLLGNAVIHGDPERPVRLEAREENGRLVLSVINHGKPIPAEVRKRLFHPFSRGEPGGTHKGLGLGLYIAREIAVAHGGTLRVKSDEMETRFTLRMPLRAPTPRAPSK
ncbi:PAS domain-containing sensor histidine kinase [Nitratireductor basaltis]|uniref:PAS domain-containing sensor histidine kinase n=1 Tax=Nitratireductor basaltis TaxID=472175 RepID=UPI001FCC87E0|nr:PAS domain-containing sensor histidine kinase [Nitratireductor basaltis]